MPKTGGRTPYDALNALTGPCRIFWAETSVAAPADLADVFAQVANGSGEYPAETGWNDFGLSADAPSYSHSKEAAGLEYEQATSELFTKVQSIARSLTVNIAEFASDTLQLLENSTLTEAVAASSAGATKKKSAATKIHAGTYTGFRRARIVLVAYRPDGAGEVVEPGGLKRPPAIGRVIPLCEIAPEDNEFEFTAGEPTSANLTFNAIADASLGVRREHGYWIVEQAGTIVT